MQWGYHLRTFTPSDSAWSDMKTRKVPVPVVALVVGAILLSACAIWAIAVQHIVPSICHSLPTFQELAGPIRCEK